MKYVVDAVQMTSVFTKVILADIKL